MPRMVARRFTACPARNRSWISRKSRSAARNCTLADLCLPHGLEQKDLEKLDDIVKRNPPYHRGDHLFRPGHKSHALFAVRSGALKSYCITEDGEEQVLGFILPGELTGMDGLAGGHYASASVALETSSVCELPFDQLTQYAASYPACMNRSCALSARKSPQTSNADAARQAQCRRTAGILSA